MNVCSFTQSSLAASRLNWSAASVTFTEETGPQGFGSSCRLPYLPGVPEKCPAVVVCEAQVISTYDRGSMEKGKVGYIGSILWNFLPGREKKHSKQKHAFPQVPREALRLQSNGHY